VEIAGGVAPWQLTYTNTQGEEETITVPSSPHIFTLTPSGATLYTLVSVADAHCTGTNVSGIAAFTEQEQPFGVNPQVTPDPTNTFVTVCFTIVGGDAATYSVAGWPGAITGNQFCSDPIPCDAGTYAFFVQDAFGCGVDTIAGPVVCNCVSGAGVMDQNFQLLCTYDALSVQAAVGVQFDANDALMYVLHTGSGNALGTIAAQSLTPSFSFDPATMDCGTTYYVSSVVGDDDGTGFVDLTDDCLSVSAGTPVLFNCLPTASISGGGVVCEGESSTASFTLSGLGPFTLTLNDGAQDISLTNITNGYQMTLSPAQTTSYTLIQIVDSLGCVSPASGSITVTVNSPVFAGTASAPVELCAGQGQLISLSDLLEGEDTGGVWTETSAAPSSGGAFNAGAGTFNTTGQPAGTYTFRYFLDAQQPCPDDDASVTVLIHPLPAADAGAPKELTCGVNAVTIGGAGTSSGPGIEYAWTLAGTSGVIGTTSTLEVTQPGTYELRVINTQTGCESTDEVVVTQNVETPQILLSTQDVSCYGESDGVIFVESVTGGKPPYLFSLNGGPYSSQQQFTNLPGGEYLISIEDANGCSSELLVVVSEPAELTATLTPDLLPDDQGNYYLDLGDELRIDLQSSFPLAQLDTITWSPSEEVTCEDLFCSQVTVAPEDGAIYAVTVTWGPCTASDQLRILVRKPRPVYIPNMFSPNFDGQNDVFYIQAGRQVARVRTFQVFNRWGEPVFRAEDFPANDPAFGWDGTLRGKSLNPGIFGYFVEVEYVDGYVEIIKGDVTLVR
jgi:gliding motility-associated-like protein